MQRDGSRRVGIIQRAELSPTGFQSCLAPLLKKNKTQHNTNTHKYVHIPEILGITIWTNQQSYFFPIGFVMETAYNFIPIPQICHYIKEHYCYWRMNSKSTSPALQATALFRGMVILSVPPFQGINITSAPKNLLYQFHSPINLVKDNRSAENCSSVYWCFLLNTYIDTLYLHWYIL